MTSVHASLGICVALACVANAQQQAAVPTEPTSRPVAFHDVATDPLLVEVTSRTQAADRNPPVVWKANRWRVAAMFGAGMPDSVINAQIAYFRTACVGSRRLDESDERLITETNPWIAFDSAAAGKPLVSFVVSPSRTASDACDDKLQMDPVGAIRGVLMPSRIEYASANDPISLNVTVDGRRLSPALLGRVLTVQPSRSPEMSQLRVYVALDDLAPRANGTLPSVRLVVETADNTVTDTLLIPDAMIRAVWYQALSYRLYRVPSSQRSSWAMKLPRPPAGSLAQAADAHERGAVKDAAMLSGSALGSTKPADRRFARFAWAHALYAGSDSAAGRLLLNEELSEEPCLASSERVATGFRAALGPIRPPARCTTAGVPGVLVHGLLAPGNGQRVTGRKVGAITFAALTSIAGGYAVWQWWGSQSDYSLYQETTSTSEAVRLFDSANDRQDIARGAAMAAVAIWAAGAIEAAVAEVFHNRRIGRVGGYGASR